ncbi:MAG TPA: hypothetical protein ACFYEA_01535 [Candidatus Tripitaka californicus]|uniref:hypothetical protein n=2 Tax=Candidatus Tripitaka californicus TaxID=3367616 RepID=UPI00402504DC|nr:hypothetical protein [Planctomycetota bacterium]
MYDNELFSQQNFHEAAQSRKEALIREIQGYDMASVLNTPFEELVKYFEDCYKMNTPRLKSGEIYLLDTPKEINTREKGRDIFSGDGYVDRSYISFTVCVPFEGDASLFSLHPTYYHSNLSREMNTSIAGNEIRLSYQEASKGQGDFEKLYKDDVKMIETNLQCLNTDAEKFNKEILGLIRQKLNERKQKAETNQSIIQSFKIPIKKRDNIPMTYTIPEVRRKPSIVEKPTKTFTPEPTLAIEEYENILTIIKDMALAMERSPKTFASLTEEEIRNFFIILLNGHYQGSATGETFNGSGRTDILIRHKNANAFIAECKFWDGQKKLTETIDQLLRYVTWRDTKTSIILFNKQADLSSVLIKAKEIIRQHGNFKCEYQLNSAELKNNETILAYKFTHLLDPEKEIYLTLLAFQITKTTSI